MTLLLREINQIAKAYDRIVSRAGAEGVQFFKQRFTEQNWVDNSTQTWKRSRRPDKRALIGTGVLRRSIRVVSKSDTRIVIGTDAKYAKIHNEGGKIPITPQMRKYFWAKYYELKGDVSEDKKGRERKNKRNRNLNKQANTFKAMALTKKDSLRIPKRQFMGASAMLNKRIERILHSELQKALKK
ncbi:MAG: phage virion morphogenesis protein [Sphingobacteriaceae bacterium]|nr:phage virion morphogenesis protein [Sphingobacteriaceae bacterium]